MGKHTLDTRTYLKGEPKLSDPQMVALRAAATQNGLPATGELADGGTPIKAPTIRALREFGLIAFGGKAFHSTQKGDRVLLDIQKQAAATAARRAA